MGMRPLIWENPQASLRPLEKEPSSHAFQRHILGATRILHVAGVGAGPRVGTQRSTHWAELRL